MRKARSGSRFLFYVTCLLAITAFGTILVANAKKWYDRYRQGKTIRALQEEITRLTKEEHAKQLLLEQLKSPFAIEREGREKLGAKKPGETVVLFPKTDDGTTEQGSAASGVSAPFFKQWERYFFQSRKL